MAEVCAESHAMPIAGKVGRGGHSSNSLRRASAPPGLAAKHLGPAALQNLQPSLGKVGQVGHSSNSASQAAALQGPTAKHLGPVVLQNLQPSLAKPMAEDVCAPLTTSALDDFVGYSPAHMSTSESPKCHHDHGYFPAHMSTSDSTAYFPLDSSASSSALSATEERLDDEQPPECKHFASWPSRGTLSELSIPDEYIATPQSSPLPPPHQCRCSSATAFPYVPESDDYDPRNPENIRSATDVEVVDGELLLVRQQIRSLELMLCAKEENGGLGLAAHQGYRQGLDHMKQYLVQLTLLRRTLESGDRRAETEVFFEAAADVGSCGSFDIGDLLIRLSSPPLASWTRRP
mmetsp:Transcript_79241/g.183895  ORF Transcript_79241/g.183895 Transcript_79241/m.183895 type:complete len:347 (-) Transcript_79241:92-1132(-)